VSDSEAPGYSDVISNPMDFARMKVKVEKKEYGSSTGAFKKLYEDFLLLVSAVSVCVLWDVRYHFHHLTFLNFPATPSLTIATPTTMNFRK
jgi:Bromodomain